MCCWGGENRRAPNEKRKQAYHARFRPRGHTRKDREEHAETAGHLSGAGQIGPANTIGKPRWHQLSSLLHIHKMGESDRYERNRKEHPCKMDSVLARGECQWQALSRPGQLSKQNPSPGQKHSSSPKPSQTASICGATSRAGTLSRSQTMRYGKRMRADHAAVALKSSPTPPSSMMRPEP